MIPINMEIHRALDQISQIHEHLARTEVCREVRAIPVCLSGIAGLAAAFLQNRLFPQPTSAQFVLFWSAVAALCLIVGGAGILYNYVKQKSALARRQTRMILGQIAPSIVAGVLVTLAAAGSPSFGAELLPGLWACLFSLGIFAARPYLPRIIGWVALFYLLAGAILLGLAGYHLSLSPWGMGLTFGIGQFASGLVLFWDLERSKNGWK